MFWSQLHDIHIYVCFILFFDFYFFGFFTMIMSLDEFLRGKKPPEIPFSVYHVLLARIKIGLKGCYYPAHFRLNFRVQDLKERRETLVWCHSK